MFDWLDAILHALAKWLGLGDSDGGDIALPGGGPLWIIALVVVVLGGAFLLWLWLG